MKVSRYAKAILYFVLSAAFLAISAVIQVSMHKQNGLESAYFRSNTYLFIAACIILGTAIYTYQIHANRRREHSSDALFFLLTGISLMLTAIIIIISCGGVTSPFGKSGYTAANVNILLMAALPVPFFLRGLVLSNTRQEENSALRRWARIVCVFVAAAYIGVLSFGGTMRFVYYDAASASVSQTTSNV